MIKYFTMYILLFVAALAIVFQTPAPIPGQTGEDAASKSDKVKNDSETHNAPANPSPATATAKYSQDGTTNANREAEGIKDSGNELPVRVVNFPGSLIPNLLNLALVIVGIGAIVAALLTLRAIRTQVRIGFGTMKANVRAARAAKASADALINSERAWVLVDIGKLPPFKPDPTQFQILWIFPTIKNYGKTVARIKRVAGIVKLIPEGEGLPPVPEYIPGQGFNDHIDMVLPPEAPMQPRLSINGQEWTQVQEGKVSLFVHGFIEYFDGVSKTQRRSAYCFGYVIQGGYSPAETGFYPYLMAPHAYTECT